MPTILETAERRLAELTQEIEKLRQFIENYKKFDDPNYDPRIKQVSTRKEKQPAHITKAVESILRDATRPLSLHEILDELAARSIFVRSKNPSDYIYAIMHNVDNLRKFKYVAPVGYCINDKHYTINNQW
jgi:hypothetical protein